MARKRRRDDAFTAVRTTSADLPSRPWRTLGTPAVPSSLPLSNLVSAVQQLIDPDFDPHRPVGDEPRYLKPWPSRIAPEDVDYLRHRGALAIPETELRDELLRCYVQWVHNFMPMLDLRHFLRCVVENDPSGHISLLLFQAVMFAGTAFVDREHLQAAGYATRKSARKAFFTRVKLLYSLDYEEDRIAILQALLLMTYWADEESSPEKDIWHWVGVCNTLAHSIGLHRDPTQSGVDPATQRLRIRLWWTLYSRDRLIAMGLRRPTHINEGTCDVPPLRLTDFDLGPFPDSVVQRLRCRQLADVSHQRCLATLFIEKVKLCRCLGRVLFAQYAPSNRHLGATDRTTITLVPRQASEAELARCSRQLDSWLRALPPEARFLPASRAHITEAEQVLLLHSAMLRMIYHATASALHRPRTTTTARTKLQAAALGITHIVQGLGQLDLTKFLPQSGVTVLLPAAAAHLVDLTSPDPTVRQVSVDRFHRCVQALQALQDIYPAADIEAAHLEAAVQRLRNESVDVGNGLPSFTDVNPRDDPDVQARSPDDADSVGVLHRPVADDIDLDLFLEYPESESEDDHRGGSPGRPMTRSDGGDLTGDLERDLGL
ncbi:hypothetical protein VTN02DRAFT_6239 [Thermoascus thermophilus]